MKVGIDVSPLHTGHKVRGIGFYTQRLLKSLKKIVDVNELKTPGEVKNQNYDLLHIPYFSPYFLTMPWPWVIKKPIVVTIHDLIPVKYPEHYPPGLKGKMKWQIQKLLLKQAKLVITDSFASKHDIAKLTGYRLDKIHVTYLAAGEQFKKIADGDWKQEVINKYGLPSKFCLYVGDVNWNKNIPGLVKACEKIKLPLVIVGKQALSRDYDQDHPENKDLRWLQKKSKKSDLVNLVGFVSDQDLVSIYNLATVYCQPSFDEGFGLPVLEAMACGCPVVSSKLGSLPEVVGKAGLLVEPTPDKLSHALQSVVNDHKLSSGLIAKGLKQAANFSWEDTGSKTLDVYQMAVMVK